MVFPHDSICPAKVLTRPVKNSILQSFSLSFLYGGFHERRYQTFLIFSYFRPSKDEQVDIFTLSKFLVFEEFKQEMDYILA